MKPHILRTTAAFILVSLVLTGLFPYCKKDATPQDTITATHPFLQLPTTADARITQIVDSLQKKVKRTTLDAVVTKYGLPVWDKGYIQHTGNKFMAFIPLVKAGDKRVTSFIVFEYAPQLKWRLYDISKPEKYGYNNGRKTTNARSIFIMGEFLNYRSFDDPTTDIGDPCMMTSRERASISNLRAARTAQPATNLTISVKFIDVTTCYAWTSCTGDGNGNCIDNVVYHVECSSQIVWIPDNYEPDPNSFEEGYTHPSNGGPSPHGNDPVEQDCNGNNDNEQEILQILPPDKPIYNVTEYMGCFDKTTGGKVTFYADQPVVESTEPFGLKEKVGHSYVTIEQNVGGTIYRRTVGFHPSQGVSPFFNKSSQSQLGDDSQVEYDVKLETTVTPLQMGNILALIEHYNPIYNIESYNCTHFAMDISSAAGLNIPRTSGWWIVGSGLNPANFGEDLKKMPGVVAQKGQSQDNTGNCN